MLALHFAAALAALGIILIIAGFREGSRQTSGDMRMGGAVLAAIGAGFLSLAAIIALIVTLIRVWS